MAPSFCWPKQICGDGGQRVPPPANMVGALKELVPPHPLPTWWGPLSTRWIKEFNSCRLSHKEEREAEKERQTPSSP